MNEMKREQNATFDQTSEARIVPRSQRTCGRPEKVVMDAWLVDKEYIRLVARPIRDTAILTILRRMTLKN